MVEETPYFVVEVEDAVVQNENSIVSKALFTNAKERFIEYASIDNKISSDVLAFINSITRINMFVDSVASLVIKQESNQIKI